MILYATVDGARSKIRRQNPQHSITARAVIGAVAFSATPIVIRKTVRGNFSCHVHHTVVVHLVQREKDGLLNYSYNKKKRSISH